MEIWQNLTKKSGSWAGPNQPATMKHLESIGYFSIGGQWLEDYGVQYFIGEICAIRLYNRVLTNEEIKENYAFDKGIFDL